MNLYIFIYKVVPFLFFTPYSDICFSPHHPLQLMCLLHLMKCYLHFLCQNLHIFYMNILLIFIHSTSIFILFLLYTNFVIQLSIFTFDINNLSIVVLMAREYMHIWHNNVTIMTINFGTSYTSIYVRLPLWYNWCLYNIIILHFVLKILSSL